MNAGGATGRWSLTWRRTRKPKSRRRRWFDRAVGSLAGLWGVILFFPQPLFTHATTVGRFKIRSDEPIPIAIEEVIGRASARLEASPLLRAEDSFSIAIANRPWRRIVMNPFGWRAFGSANLVTGNTILNRSDVAADTCSSDMPSHNQRALHGVIAHECTHQLLRRRLGLIAAWRLPRWKNEGYCEYVAGETSFDHGRAIDLLALGRSDPSPAFQYVTYYLAVRHLLDSDGLSLEELLTRRFDHDGVIAAAVAMPRGDARPEEDRPGGAGP